MGVDTKKLLILDVDETLLFASRQSLDRAPDCSVGPYVVYCRPYLEEFLHSCQDKFELAVWSSSSADYLDAIVAKTFPPEIHLKFVWSRSRCVQRFDFEWQEAYFVKDLRKVRRAGFNLDRVLIVDDTPKKVERNYGNAIYVTPYFGQTDDDELRRLAKYLDVFRSITNVRTVEKRNWRHRSE